MEAINRRYIWLFFAILIAVMMGAYILNTLNTPMFNKPIPFRSDSDEDSSYFIVKDTMGKIILQTGMSVQVDDQYIDEHNVQYIITSVDGQNAIADVVSNAGPVSAEASAVNARVPFNGTSIPVQAAPGRHVVIYHTHSDESYTPSSGTPSQPGAGDVFTVGNILTDSLQKSGISVTHSLATHDPHDINAYNRSRRTLTQLLKEQPDAAYDVHRDSAPASAYMTTINGVDTSRIMMVVGRSNPNMQVNLNYAKTIKATADNLYPGLIRGIFIGHGDYNQDLLPTAMLFEIGTETIPIELPENAARFLGDVITHVFAGG